MLAKILAVCILALVAPQSSSTRPATQKTQPDALKSACDFVYGVAVKTPGVSIRRRSGTFADETLAAPVVGCGMTISGSFARAEQTGDATERVRKAFSERGWEEMAAYGADGHDGTSFAFRKADVSCFVRGTWNGGADDEPPIPAEDWYKATMFCTSPAFTEKRF